MVLIKHPPVSFFNHYPPPSPSDFFQSIMSSNTKERTPDDDDGKDIEEQKTKAKIHGAWKADEEYILPKNNMPVVHLLLQIIKPFIRQDFLLIFFLRNRYSLV